MAQRHFGVSYWINSPSNLSFEHVHKLEDYDSETDVTDVESIYPVSTPLRKVKTSRSSQQDPPPTDPSRSNFAEKRHRTTFRPELDVPKVRNSDTGFNRIRQVKDEDFFTGTKTESEDKSLLIEDCNENEQKKDIFTYTQPVDEVPCLSAAGRTVRAKYPKRESSVRAFKVEKPTTHKRNPHNRSQGPSMSRNAIDYRERKVVQEQYREHLATLLDIDIVKQVDDEGGITPLGRLYKASVRMLERVKEERGARIIFVPDIKVDRDEKSATEFERMHQRALKAEGAYQRLKSDLKALLRSSDSS